MKSRLSVALVIVGVLALAGAGLGRMVAPAWDATRGRQPALRLDSSVTAAGQGVTLALLGGFRALVADVTWVRMYTIWERRDLTGTQSLVQLVTAIDPRPVYFWVNGARILGHDLAAWRIEAAGGYEAVGPGGEQRINREQGARALRHLDAAMSFHPESADLWVERASIELLRMRDVLAAAECYRRAWEKPGAPYYVARLYAEMLRRGGRPMEAWRWLAQLHPTLPANDEAAGRDVVLGRIRDLERELGIPASQTYRPAP